MKNLNNKEFTIEKTTMRDLTRRELNEVAGASHCNTVPHSPGWDKKTGNILE